MILESNAELTVNGELRVAEGVALPESLLFTLRERLGLYGTKNACEQGECGSCTVLLDGEPVCACLVMTHDAAGAEITTVEGLRNDPVFQSVSRVMEEAGSVQCGFCIPGFAVMIRQLAARDELVGRNDILEELSGNLCRCTGYGRILAAAEELCGANAVIAPRDGGVSNA